MVRFTVRRGPAPRSLCLPALTHDPLASYSVATGKQPKRLGMLELVRGLPHLAGVFAEHVPAERFVVADGQAAVRCDCDAVTHVEHNRAEPCEGECGRWFWHIGTQVRVAREPDAQAA